MTTNLNRPAIQPGKLTQDDFARSQPAEACTDVGLDLDDDGSLYTPTPMAVLVRGLGACALVLALVAAVVFGMELQALVGRAIAALAALAAQ